VADGGITGINLRAVRKLINDKSISESALDAVDDLLGAVIVLSPLVAGPAALPLLALIEPKNELVKFTKNAIKAITKSQASDYLDQAARMAAANCLLTFTAYFDALDQLLPALHQEIGLTEEDKKSLVAAAGRAASQPGSEQDAASFPGTNLDSRTISMPHPAVLEDARAARLGLYREMSKIMLDLLPGLRGLRGWPRLPALRREQATKLIEEQLPSLACSLYEAEYLEMATDFPQFFVWSVLRDQQHKDALLRTVGADLRTQFELVASALQTVDFGLGHLAAAIRQIPQAAGTQPLRPALGTVAEELHRQYEDEIGRPVIDDRYEAGDGRPQLTYPTKAGSYVPQAYRLARYTDESTHLERDEVWSQQVVHDDLGPFLMCHLESPYSVETPLLILGHPGSGKSLLTQVIAAHLAYPRYTTVRVELRDVNPDADIQAQIEGQIRKDTGRDVNWADFADNLPMSPPVVILDGYDELLQATGNLFAGYLDQVRRFQHREAVQRRPVRVIVTSRMTLIEKAIVPSGATVVRLEEFDEERRQAWTAVWNTRNDGYFRQAGIRPFALPDNEKLTQLAEQPLLLLMLAIYDSSGNKLSSRPDIDQTLLYYELLARFIERERSKGADGAAFIGLPEADRDAEIDRDMERLGVAAIGMFNRQDVKIRREELNADLAYFAAQPGQATDGTRRMSPAELLLGSFFFVHESRSRLADDSAGPGQGPAAFEFLHNTFGEFLAADFILRKVLAEASAICTLSEAADLGDTLRQRLAMISPSWFARLVHTPLHTRPNILAMLREWGIHRLAHSPRPRAELLRSLDMIVVAQLRALLTQTSPAGLPTAGAGAAQAPYAPLPVLGHLAVYSLNLILLSSFLGDGTYILDEADLRVPSGGVRPWDRLTGLWRSWFPLESLGVLAELLTVTRDGTRIQIAPVRSLLVVPVPSSLYATFNAALALADDVVAVSAGLQVASLLATSGRLLRDLRTRAQAGVPELVPVVDSMVPRMFGDGSENLPVFLDNVPGYRLLAAENPKVPGYVLGILEMADRLMITPRQRMGMPVNASDIRALTMLSRYEAELAVRVRNELDDRWLPYLLVSESDITAKDWRRFLASPAAAPALRAGWQCLNRARCRDIAATIADAWPDLGFEPFDVDTAAALAVLAWRGGNTALCARALEAIMAQCEQGAWSLLDIPIGTWGGLADLFASGDPVIENQRTRFAAFVEIAVDEVLGIEFENVQVLAEFSIHALRIGAVKQPGDVVRLIHAATTHMFSLSSKKSQRWVLLLIRWAHEKNDRALIRQMAAEYRVFDDFLLVSFGEKRLRSFADLDVDELAMELTYREATDIRWFVDVLREERP
jgi:hypothetical protein